MATLTELTSQIVTSFLSKNMVTPEVLQVLIKNVHDSLKGLEQTVEEVSTPEVKMSLKEAFGKNEIKCMVCGAGNMKILAPHLKKAHGLSPKEYRKQFAIPASVPLAAKAYSQKRKDLALFNGLADRLKAGKASKLAEKKTIKALKSIKKGSETVKIPELAT